MSAEEILDRFHNMSYGDFTKLVNRDTRNNTAAIEAAALRDPSLRTKWRHVLAQLRREIENQLEAKRAELASKGDDPEYPKLAREYEAWHASAVRVRAGLDERIAEAEFLSMSETSD